MRFDFSFTKRARTLLLIAVVLVACTLPERILGPLQAQTTTRTGPNTYPTYSTRVQGAFTGTTGRTDNITCAGASCPTGTYEVIVNMGTLAANTAGTAGATVTASNGTSSNTVAVTSVVTNLTSGYGTGTGLLDYTAGQTFNVAFTTSGAFTGTANLYYTVTVRRVRQP